MVKAISTRISSTEILLPTNAPTQNGFWACSTPEATLLSVSRSDSVNSRRAPSLRTSISPTVTAASVGSNALLLYPSKRHLKFPGAYCLPELYADFTSRVWITITPTPHETRHSSFSNPDRPRPLQSTSQLRFPPVLRQNVGGQAARRDG